MGRAGLEVSDITAPMLLLQLLEQQSEDRNVVPSIPCSCSLGSHSHL